MKTIFGSRHTPNGPGGTGFAKVQKSHVLLRLQVVYCLEHR